MAGNSVFQRKKLFEPFVLRFTEPFEVVKSFASADDGACGDHQYLVERIFLPSVDPEVDYEHHGVFQRKFSSVHFFIFSHLTEQATIVYNMRHEKSRENSRDFKVRPAYDAGESLRQFH